MEASENNIILEMRDIDKAFPGVHALKKCQFSLNKGEIHALIGENGAGKSTLVKIMTGIHSEYGGEYWFDGKMAHFNGPRDAQRAGISIVHQELNMMNDLSVAKNIFIGRESNGFFCSDKLINQKTKQLIDEFDINVTPTELLKNLTVGKAQMVEIARAMSYETTKVLILDEPTAALSEAEAEELFAKLRAVKGKGVAVVFISHRLDEVKCIADRVTVMRDGTYVDTRPIEQMRVEDMVQLMIGREIFEEPKQISSVAADAPVVLEVEKLNSSKVKDVSFRLRRGEILGFAGLVGAGRTETMRLICGADKMESGRVKLNGKPCTIRHPKDAVKNGIGYLSEDRKRYGLVLDMTVTDNVVLPSYHKLSSRGFVRSRLCLKKTQEYVEKLNIKTPSVRSITKTLSGGNQQKVVVAKWLLKDTQVLIFDEPTRGIDVGAKAEIYHLMQALANEGKSIIMVSSDLTEILRMSDYVIVMREGRITGELDIKDADQKKIMTYATMDGGKG